MDALMYHMHPWKQKSIAKAEDLIKKRVAQQTEKNISMVHKCVNAFELRVLSRPTPTIDLTALQEDVQNLWADGDSILEMRGNESKIAPFKLTENTVFVALFVDPTKL